MTTLRHMGGTEADHKEWFSRAFVMAVAASAGFAVQPIQDDVDGVDVELRDGGITVDVQLKATAVPEIAGGFLKFDLDVKTYDKLRKDRNSPGYLVVAILPKRRTQWIAHKADHMRMLRRAYWLELTGMKDTANGSTIRLSIPLENEVTELSLRQIMNSARVRAMV